MRGVKIRGEGPTCQKPGEERGERERDELHNKKKREEPTSRKRGEQVVALPVNYIVLK